MPTIPTQKSIHFLSKWPKHSHAPLPFCVPFQEGIMAPFAPFQQFAHIFPLIFLDVNWPRHPLSRLSLISPPKMDNQPANGYWHLHMGQIIVRKGEFGQPNLFGPIIFVPKMVLAWPNEI
jgi:hypothetical protein